MRPNVLVVPLLLVLALLTSATPAVGAEVPPEDLADPALVVDPAPTGHPWRPVLGPFAKDGALFNATAGRGQFAMTRVVERGPAEIWASTDGRRWSRSVAPRTGGSVEGTRLWFGRKGWVYVELTSERPLEEQTLTFWRSRGLERWTRLGTLRLTVPPALRGCMLWVEGFGETADGLVVTADLCRRDCCGSITPGVRVLAQNFPIIPGKGGVFSWTSPDGADWTRHRATGVATGTLTSYVQDGPGVAAILDQGVTGILVRSTDGIAWRPVSTVPPEVDLQNGPTIVPAGDGWVVTGDVSTAAGVTTGNQARVWRVDRDGTWAQVLDLPHTSVNAGTSDGSRVMLTGTDQRFDEAPDVGWTRLSLDGGRTWELSTGWPGMVGICFSSLALRDELAVASTSCEGALYDPPSAWLSRLDLPRIPPVDPFASPAPEPSRPLLAPPLPGPAGTPARVRTERRPNAVVEQDGVRLELWTARDPVSVGAWLPAAVRVTNTGDAPIRHVGSARQPACDDPTRAWVDTAGLWEPVPLTTSSQAAVGAADALLAELTQIPLGVVGDGRSLRGCRQEGTTEALAPGASFTVPLATWVRHAFRDQPLPSGTVDVVASYRFTRGGGDPVTVSATAPVELRGEPVGYASPRTIVAAVVAEPAIAAGLASVPLEGGTDCCDLTDRAGVMDAPGGHTFTELGYAGGPAPVETVGVSIATEGAVLRARLDPWTGTVTSVGVDGE
jgi:hypothetical protein